jgi:hypothetical protein
MENPSTKDTQLYIKIGKRYKPIQSEFLHLFDQGSRPADGMWYIRKNQSTWIGENPTPERINNEPLKDIIANAISNLGNEPISAMGIATKIVEAISEYQIKIRKDKDNGQFNE